MLFALLFACAIAVTTVLRAKVGGDSGKYGRKLVKKINATDKRRMKSSRRRQKERNVVDLNTINE
jgi:hypothetical protein